MSIQSHMQVLIPKAVWLRHSSFVSNCFTVNAQMSALTPASLEAKKEEGTEVPSVYMR